MLRWVTLFIILVWTSRLSAQVNSAEPIVKEMGEHNIYLSVFNSSFLPPAVAQAYQLVRGKDKAILNVAITADLEQGETLGLPVRLRGAVKNLLQQEVELVFQEIDEGDAVYYIAPFEFDDRELLHFDLDILLPGQRYSDHFEFSKILYFD